MNTKLGFASLLSVTIIFSLFGFFARVIGQKLTPLQQLSAVYFIGLVLVLGLFAIKKQHISTTKLINSQTLIYIVLINVSVFLSLTAFIESKLSVAISGFYSGTIVISVVISYFLLKEKITRRGLVGIIIVFIGFIFLNNLSLTQFLNIGLLFATIAGTFYGVSNYKKKVLTNYSREEFLLINTFSIFLVMGVISFINGEKLNTNISVSVIVALIIFAAISQFSEYLTIYGLRNFNLYLASIVLSMEIFFTVIVGYLFFKEIPTTYEWIGILMVFVAVVVTNLPERKAKITSKK